jgi:2-amino-4-hydroxy-6-hydroxymethyldihydropteridine diphosphokinase
MTTSPVLLGLGANLGDPVRQISAAVDALRAQVAIDAVSSLYRSAPVGFAEQADFYNVVCGGTTRLAPEELLAEEGRIEEALGRIRSFRNAPRLIDVDILALGDRVIDTPRLTVPHPAIASRGFVLHPLAEVAPDWRHPLLGRSARELLRSAVGLERVEALGALPLLS